MIMHDSIHLARPQRRPSRLPWLVAGMALVLALLAWQHLAHQSADHSLKMEKSSGRNEAHANQKARESAEKAYEKAKESYEKLKSKPSKSKEDTEMRKKLKKLLEHLRKKKDWNGENHSQTSKGK